MMDTENRIMMRLRGMSITEDEYKFLVMLFPNLKDSLIPHIAVKEEKIFYDLHEHRRMIR